MKYSLLLFFFLIGLSFGHAQNRIERLEELQALLNDLQTDVNKPDSVWKNEIKVQMNAIGAIKRERDSLKSLVELLKAELMLANGKLEAKEKAIEAIAQKNKVQDNSKESNCYVVVLSGKNKIDMSEKLIQYQKKYTENRFLVVENENSNWYYLCFSETYARSRVGSEVSKVRREGFDKAWYIAIGDLVKVNL